MDVCVVDFLVAVFIFLSCLCCICMAALPSPDLRCLLHLLSVFGTVAPTAGCCLLSAIVVADVLSYHHSGLTKWGACMA